jgi:hypothetical protein
MRTKVYFTLCTGTVSLHGTKHKSFFPFCPVRNNKEEDTFGEKDSDWDVYKQISREVEDSDSEEETLKAQVTVILVLLSRSPGRWRIQTVKKRHLELR